MKINYIAAGFCFAVSLFCFGLGMNFWAICNFGFCLLNMVAIVIGESNG